MLWLTSSAVNVVVVLLSSWLWTGLLCLWLTNGGSFLDASTGDIPFMCSFMMACSRRRMRIGTQEIFRIGVHFFWPDFSFQPHVYCILSSQDDCGGSILVWLEVLFQYAICACGNAKRTDSVVKSAHFASSAFVPQQPWLLEHYLAMVQQVIWERDFSQRVL